MNGPERSLPAVPAWSNRVVFCQDANEGYYPTYPHMIVHKPKRPGSRAVSASAASVSAVTPAPVVTPTAGVVLRPLARVQRIALFEREVRERLSRAALDVLFARAEVISEGQRTVRNAQPAYFGSTMLTIDLSGLSSVLREACDAGTARRLATLLAGDASVKKRVEVIAASEAARIVGNRLRTLAAEMKVTARAVRVFIDVDVEGTP